MECKAVEFVIPLDLPLETIQLSKLRRTQKFEAQGEDLGMPSKAHSDEAERGFPSGLRRIFHLKVFDRMGHQKRSLFR